MKQSLFLRTCVRLCIFSFVILLSHPLQSMEKGFSFGKQDKEHCKPEPKPDCCKPNLCNPIDPCSDKGLLCEIIKTTNRIDGNTENLPTFQEQVEDFIHDVNADFDSVFKDLHKIICKENCILNDIQECCADLGSRIEQVDVDLAECCFTLNSKIDVLNFSEDACCFTINSKLDDCCSTLISRVDSVQSTDNTILSRVDAVQDNLDACCFTLNSAIDQLDFVDLANCCATLNSKVDQVQLTESTILSRVDALQDGLDDCCSTLISRVDSVQSTDNTILSRVDAVQNNLDACCFTLNSAIDQLDFVDLANCCATLSSKVDEVQLTDNTILSRVDALQDGLDDCCSTLISRVDSVQSTDNTILSRVDAVQNNLDACCFTLNSAIDQLDFVDLANCCATLSSKVDEVQLTDNTILSRVDALQDSLDNCCASLNSKIDVIAAEECTQIFGPTTITASGTFCLVADVIGASPAIVIDHNDVVLDLSGHRITNCGSIDQHGVRIIPGTRNIVIKNGSLEIADDIVCQTAVNGIEIPAGTDQTNNIRLENLFISGWAIGINADSAYELSIINCNVNNNAVRNIGLTNCQNVTVEQSAFTSSVTGVELSGGATESIQFNNSLVEGNASFGVIIQPGVSRARFVNCVFNQNAQSAVRAVLNSCIEFIDCSAHGIAVDHTGFDIDSCSGVLINNCTTCDFNIGFNLRNNTGLCVNNSFAQSNHVGFNISGSSSQAILQNNTATNNFDAGNGAGFSDDAAVGAHNEYYRNVACENDQNFINVVSASVTSPANARGVKNVACDDTAQDQVELTLSKVGVVETKLDACCFTLNSAIDQLDFVDLANCCATVNSKIDEVQLTDDAILTGVLALQGSLIDCCGTLGSQIDKLDFSALSRIDGLQNSVDDCCFTLNSKVDEVQSTDNEILNAVNSGQSSFIDCCFTLQSRLDDLTINNFTLASKLDECCYVVNSRIEFVIDQITP